jgi:hypothetical protein
MAQTQNRLQREHNVNGLWNAWVYLRYETSALLDVTAGSILSTCFPLRNMDFLTNPEAYPKFDDTQGLKTDLRVNEIQVVAGTIILALLFALRAKAAILSKRGTISERSYTSIASLPLVAFRLARHGRLVRRGEKSNSGGIPVVIPKVQRGWCL